MTTPDRLALLGDLVAAARRAGADAADAVLVSSQSLEAQCRLGQTEHVERAESADLGLRVFVGRQTAIVSAAGLEPRRFAELAAHAVAMARVLPEDPFAGLAEAARAVDTDDLDLVDAAEPDVATLTARALAAEAAAMAVSGVTNSEGAGAGWGRVEALLVTSAGFAGRSQRTSHSLSATVLAGSGTAMQRDYDAHASVHAADLDAPELLGRRAGERAVRRLNPTRPRTARLPVVFDPRVAGSLLGHLAGAINGAAVARGTTFLKDAMGSRIMPQGMVVRDDPRRRRGLRSRSFDGEGVPTRELALVEDGILQTWVLDSASARQLGLASTGSAMRGTSGPPSPGTSNLFMAAGTLSPAALMAGAGEGLYVTEMIGMGVNGLTGDYSRGAAGFMIRHGELAEPVAEITIAGNLREMFRAITPADDLRFRRGVDAPTLLVDGMTMAGA
ncbi:MAG: TldD/PmbA family protein [Rhodospirillales bacterium]|nr:TldD/PmbA family protein [Rhodospirillales bacterium]